MMEIVIRIFWPLINYAKITQEVLIKGMDFMTVLPHIFEMVLYGIVWLTIGVAVYKKVQCNHQHVPHRSSENILGPI